MIACPRCKAGNDRWEPCCKACGLQFAAAWRASDTRASDEHRMAPQGTKPDPSVPARNDLEHDAHHQALADLLGIEVAHVQALADAGIHPLEHIAESIPEHIRHALRDWSHIDPAALIERAAHLLRHRDPPSDTSRSSESEPRAKPEPHATPAEPDPAQWWKLS